MTGEQQVWLMLGIAFLIVVSFPVVYWSTARSKKKQLKAMDSGTPNAESGAEVVRIHARVVDMTCGVETYGSKRPKVAEYFIIKLQKDDGDLLDVTVNGEMYDGFEVGLTGTLSLIDGFFYSFEPDEPN